MQNPLSEEDSHALLRLLSLAEGSVAAAPDSALARQLRDSLAVVGLLSGDAPVERVARALAHLQARYRYSLGEYTERVVDGHNEPDNVPSREGTPLDT